MELSLKPIRPWQFSRINHISYPLKEYNTAGGVKIWRGGEGQRVKALKFS